MAIARRAGTAGPAVGPHRTDGGVLPPIGRIRQGWLIWAEIGFAAALLALVWQPQNRYLVGAVVFVAIVLAVPVHHRSLLSWATVAASYLVRHRRGVIVVMPGSRSAAPPRGGRPRSLPSPPSRSPALREPTGSRVGIDEAQDSEPTATLLSAVVPGLTVTSAYSADGAPVGLIGLDGRWTIVLAVRSDQQVLARVGEADTLPLSALTPLLRAAGIQLESIQLVVLNSPGSSALPERSAALASHLELLGGLPTAARRRVLVALRLDPRSCPLAIEARGGGSLGTQRALIATAARAVSVLAEAGFDMRTLSATETAAAVASFAGLHQPALGAGAAWKETWDVAQLCGLYHRSYLVYAWGDNARRNPLDQLANIRARAVSTSLSISGDPGNPELTATARVTASNSPDLAAAHEQLLRTARLVQLDLTAANGAQYEAFTAGLPLGGPRFTR